MGLRAETRPVSEPLAFERRIYASLVLGILGGLPVFLLFLDIKIKFNEFTFSRLFFKVVRYFI